LRARLLGPYLFIDAPASSGGTAELQEEPPAVHRQNPQATNWGGYLSVTDSAAEAAG
jgi:hypothetical protein